MLEKQLSSCGGSAEESSDNTTTNATSDGNTITGGQVASNQTFKRQTTVIMKNKSLDNSELTFPEADPRTLQRQNTRTIRIHRQRRLSLAGKITSKFFRICLFNVQTCIFIIYT
jgi:hypothetical protein